MSRKLKILSMIALLSVGVWFVGGRIFLPAHAEKPADKPAEKSQAKTEGKTGEKTAAAPDDQSLDLNEKQVKSLTIVKAGVATFKFEQAAVGNIDFNQSRLSQVFTPYPGRIIEAYPKVGDKVEKDQVLFTIDSPDLLAAENSLIAAAGVLTLQNRTLARSKKLVSFGGASQQSLDQSTSDQMTAEGALRAARDAVRIFGKTQLEIDHIIEERRADPKLVVESPALRLCHRAHRLARTFCAAGRGAGALHRRRSFDDVDVRQYPGI